MKTQTEIKRFSFEDPGLSRLSMIIRNEVFVKEQGVPAALEYDGEDTVAHHYLLFVEGEAVATARWRDTVKGIKLERFAMLKSYRNKGLGNIILDAVLLDVLRLGKPIYLHSQARAVSFYERKGFCIDGDSFEEAGIKHYKMVWPSGQRVIHPAPL